MRAGAGRCVSVLAWGALLCATSGLGHGTGPAAQASPARRVHLAGYEGAHADAPGFGTTFGALDGLAASGLATVEDRLGLRPTDVRRIHVQVRDADVARLGADRARCVTCTVGGAAVQRIELFAPYFLSGDADLPTVLTHELVHAVMRDRMGPEAYGRLPTWAREGLAVHVADQGPRHLQRTLLVYESVEALMTGLVEDGRDVRMYPYSWLAVAYLDREGGPAALRRWARGLVAGRDVRAAVLDVVGGTWRGFEAGVRAYAQARVEEAAAGLDLVRRARRLYRAQRFPETRTVCALFLKTYPASAFAPTARYLAARSWFREGRYAHAAAGFRVSLAQDRGTSGWLDECQLFLGMALCELDQLAQGVAALRRYVELHPQSNQRDLGCLALGRALRRMGEAAQAREVLETAARMPGARPSTTSAARRELAALGG